MDNQDGEQVLTALTTQGIRFALLDEQAKRKIRQEWRRTFSSAVKEQTGKWTHLGFDWHTFSYKFKKSVEGGKALEAYQTASTVGFYVFADGDEGQAFKCAGKTLPKPDGMSGGDVYIFPLDFSWTMVFTHEESDCGPYYAVR